MTIRDEIGDPANGDQLIDALDDRFDVIWNGVMLHMTSVGGTADAVTATVTPAVGVDGYLNGMAFSIVWDDANTVSNFTLNGLPVVGPAGEALPIGAVESGLASVLLVVDDEFRIMSNIVADVENAAYYWQVTSSQSITWPTNLPGNRRVRVQAWAGGGGGHSSGGAGGGGGYAESEFRLSTLGASTTCTIGAGGSVAAAGGNTTFGSLLTAYGGGAGTSTNGGAGGGTNAVGTNGLAGGGYLGGGDGGYTIESLEQAPKNATSIWGGAGGAIGTMTGGNAVFGGAGGSAGSGGTSKFGGAGGGNGVAGTAPAGAGGRNAAGARGEIRIWIG
jgi:hypothetical protein